MALQTRRPSARTVAARSPAAGTCSSTARRSACTRTIDETPIAARHLTGRCVYDLVYNPPLTRLLREAAPAGCQTIGGLDMLVAQAHEQFDWWTGVRRRPA